MSEIIAALSLALTAFVVVAGIGHRVLRGQYATRDWVEAKMKPLSDADVLQMGRLRDVEAEHKLLKERISHMPTIDHIEELRGAVAELKTGQGITRERLDGLKDGQDRIERTLEGLAEDIRRNR